MTAAAPAPIRKKKLKDKLAEKERALVSSLTPYYLQLREYKLITTRQKAQQTT